MYRTEPRKTIPAPSPSCAFQPLPNHHTLKQRLSALRVVSTRFVDTDDTRCTPAVRRLRSAGGWNETYGGELVYAGDAGELG